MTTDPNDPHAGALVLTNGALLKGARAAVLALHGRGAGARDILALTKVLDLGDSVAVVAPEAAGNTWYPYSFLAPLGRNEPYLSSALKLLDTLVTYLADHDIPAERVVLLGFSQGACLAAEYAARRARRWGGVVVLTGGLIGPDGTPRDYEGALDGTPVFLGAGDPDAHVPWTRVEETAAVFERLGAAVTMRRYPGMPHTVNEDEITAVQALLDGLR
ncbi:MAG: alpha/beta hydrolase [Thermomicrobiales bacterium]